MVIPDARFDDRFATSPLVTEDKGVVFYAGVKAAAPHFLARGDTRTPMLCSLLGIAANLVVALGFVDRLGVDALALAVAVGAAVNYGSLRLLARRRFGPASAPRPGFFLRCILASALLGVGGWLVQRTWLAGDAAVSDPWLHGPSPWRPSAHSD